MGWIILSSNKIKQIDKLAFCKLPQLICINLQNNQIKKIDKNSFRGLISLERIDLRQNKLEYSRENKLILYLEYNVEYVFLQSHLELETTDEKYFFVYNKV